MNDTEQNINVENAQSSLDIIQKAKQDTIKSFRPSVSISMLAAVLFGFETTAAAYSSGSSLWSFITIVSTVLFVSLMTFWYYSKRMDGKKMRIKPNGLKGNVFVWVQFAVIGLIIVGSIELYQAGHNWAPVTGGVLNACIVLVSLHYFPTHDFIKMELSNG